MKEVWDVKWAEDDPDVYAVMAMMKSLEGL